MNTMLSGDLAVNSLYMISCTLLLVSVVVGVAMFYSGLTQRRSSLTMLSLPFLLSPFVIIEWFIWGYSLCYASSSNRFIGNLNFAVLRNLKPSIDSVYSTPRGEILTIIHFLFNGFMKLICVAFTFPGCIGERGRVLPMLVFLFAWSIIIYNPVTYWFWNREGWLSAEHNNLPVLDFAGGTCIHIVSGFTALAYSYILGPRNPKILYDYRASNTGFIILGTALVSFGWCGFIAGCGYIFTAHTIFIVVNTIICSSMSGLVWLSIDYYYSAFPFVGETDKPRRERKISMTSLCSGIMAGLVVMTPAGGYVSSSDGVWKSFVFGAVGGAVGNWATRIKFYFSIDDAFDVFAIHGVVGWVGSLLTGIFAEDAYGSKGGWVNGHWIQICYQLLGCTMTSVYVFCMSMALLYIIDFIPGCHLRIDKGYNRRVRDQKKNKSALDVESSVSPGDTSEYHDKTEAEASENTEVRGCDDYEFNGEYLMDFMEFIRVINPDEYIEDVAGVYNDYEPYAEAHNLTKRSS